ncbi:FecR family protein [Sphingobacterium gobiense]|uniref:Iron dicitrate transport regulator FecR n=1 Tax=Sphingobacterium gobiense TaxID=1382456 RepID=A0A2S9JTW8_9SPHI|nr:FecR domain-containing protein [Sphingobacterium gobiense]PRD56693.1 hypothetical protein C5749_05535 [Sphingobacterium gobiense]
MKEKDLFDLIEKYKKGDISSAEKRILFQWYNEELFNKNVDSFEEDVALEHIINLDKQFGKRTKTPIIWLRYAAAVLAFLLCFWGLFALLEKPRQDILAEENDTPSPPTIKAYAFLSNGDSILLDGEVNKLKSINLNEQVIGKLSHNDSTRDLWITIKTPMSGKFQFILPDGSAVWLNTDSELSYPQSFGHSAREVKLIGEAYFEVAKQQENNRHIPFVVRSSQQDVKVLGTKFNITAYPNDRISTTTLIEGAVEVTARSKTETLLLRPNEQTVISSTGMEKNPVRSADITSWMQGYIVLRELDLPSIARIIERNYGVSFVDKNLPSDVKISGELQTDVNLEDLLHTLQINTGIKFKREGRRIIMER